MAASHPHEKTASSQNASADIENAMGHRGKHQDIAIAIVGEHRQNIDPAIEAQVVRKIDLFLVPAMFIGYGLVYYDKVLTYSCVLEPIANINRQFLDLLFCSE